MKAGHLDDLGMFSGKSQMREQLLSHLDIRPNPNSEELALFFALFRLKFEALWVEQIIIENVVANLLKNARWPETR